MGKTANYNLPYPEESDVADVPVDMRALADAVDVVLKALGDKNTAQDASVAALTARLTAVEGQSTSTSGMVGRIAKGSVTVPAKNNVAPGQYAGPVTLPAPVAAGWVVVATLGSVSGGTNYFVARVSGNQVYVYNTGTATVNFPASTVEWIAMG